MTTLENNIRKQRLAIRKKYEGHLSGYSSTFHNPNIFKTSRQLIHESNYRVTLYHWFIRTTKSGSQYISGYLANGCYWVTSSIKNVSFSWDEHNLGHFRVVTSNNTVYCLSYTRAAFSTSWFNLKRNSRDVDHEVFFDMSNSIFLTQWEIVDKGFDYDYSYHLRGRTVNNYLDNPLIDSAEIESIVLKYDQNYEDDYEHPTLLIKTVNDFTFMVYPNESHYLNEYIRI